MALILIKHCLNLKTMKQQSIIKQAVAMSQHPSTKQATAMGQAAAMEQQSAMEQTAADDDVDRQSAQSSTSQQWSNRQ